MLQIGMIILSQSETVQFSFTGVFDIFCRTKCNKAILLQSVTGFYYKVRQLLQNVTDCYYRVRQIF